MLKNYPKRLQLPLVLTKLFILRIKGILLQIWAVLSLMVGLLLKKLRLYFDSKRFKAYNSIEYLPIWNFHKAIENNDLRYILKVNYEKLPKTDYQPIKEWDNIVKENALDVDSGQLNQTQKEEISILMLRQEMYILTACFETLSYKASSQCIDILKKYTVEIDLENMESYLNSLKILSNRIEALKTKIGIKTDEFNAKNKHIDTGVKYDFSKTYSELTKSMGVYFDPRQRTVKEYNSTIKVLNDNIKNNG